MTLNNSGVGSFSAGRVNLVNGINEYWFHVQSSTNFNSFFIPSWFVRSTNYLDGTNFGDYLAGNITNAVLAQTFETTHGYVPDQIGDPDVNELNGQSLMLYDVALNTSSNVWTSIALATYAHPLVNLVQDNNTNNLPLVNELKFNGNANDASYYGLNATTTGSPSYTTGQDGVANHAIALTGSSYVTTAINNIGFPSGTVYWWMNPTDVFNSGTIRMIFQQTTPDTNSAAFGMQVFSDNNIYAGWHNGGEQRVVLAASSANYIPGQWHFYAFTWNPLGSKLWMDGVPIGTSTTPPVAGNFVNPLYIGSTIAHQSSFNGAIDDFNICQTELSSNAIVSLFNAGAK